MRKNRFLDLYQNFNAKERKQFVLYVHSVFFNQNKNLQALIQGIEQCVKTKKTVDKREMYSLCFPQETFNELKYNNLISDLLYLLYDFLAQSRYNREKVLQKQLLIRTLLDQECLEPCVMHLERYTQLQETTSWQDSNYWYAAYQLQDLQDQHLMSQEKRAYTPHLQSRSDALDRFYQLEKIKIACDMASRSTAVKADYQCAFIDDIIHWYQNNPRELTRFPAFQLYLAAYNMFTYKDDQAYLQLKGLLETHLKLIPQQELRQLYTYVLNFAVLRINSGENQYYQEILLLYKLLLDEAIIFKNGTLTQWTFTNIITAGIRTRDYEWTERFIEDYQHYLTPDVHQNVYTYNLVNLYFEKKDYPSALRMLHNVEFTDAFYHLSAKLIQLKTYYLLAENEALLALINATRRFVQRNRQLSDYQKKSSLNFLHILQRLSQLQHVLMNVRDAGKFKKQLRNDLDTLQPLANKQWLEEVLEQKFSFTTKH
ncbi:MAG: hypothetical protein SFV55_14565 [Haliscomenobacter sp.]|uniref:hypothetical protein n=1 Tax=Haliscomenobacter sp. TaxID=2717303 RepID=UPI0029B84CF6|nr:hypothetical protein [Haliscomenobacter sp.]MDX2069648.1 hypothetical protein [Haliscomenobacter sp.]